MLITGLQKSRLLASYFPGLNNGRLETMIWNYGKRPCRHLPSLNGEIDKNRLRTISDVRILDKGYLVYFENHREPLRNLLRMEQLEQAAIWKKAIVYFAKNILEQNLIGKITGLISLKVNYSFYRDFVYNALYDYCYDNPDRYSQPVREIYRVMEDFPKEREMVAFFLGDHAYLWRLQDIFSELNKNEFAKNPGREISRLLIIMMNREISLGMKGKWEWFIKLIPTGFLLLKIFKRKLYNKILKAVDSLDIKEIEATKEDLYWMNKYDMYDFRGLSFPIRKIINGK
jgi:hypothetical protein